MEDNLWNIYNIKKLADPVDIISPTTVDIPYLTTSPTDAYLTLYPSDKPSVDGSPNGEPCNSDETCKSGHCNNLLFFKGKCIECENDNHCEGPNYSRTGEMPKAFCYEDDDLPRCSKFKYGKPISEKGYPLWFAGQNNAQWIKRIVVDDPPLEQIWHWDLNNQPKGTNFQVIYDGHVIKIPKNVETIAGFSSKYNTLNEEKSGIVTSVFSDNESSLITSIPQWGMVEKYHILTWDGSLDTTHAEKAKEIVKNRTEIENKEAIDSSFARATYMIGEGTLGHIIAELEAALDNEHLFQIREFVKKLNDNHQSFHSFTSQQSESLRVHSKKAKEALIDAKTKTSLLSENFCQHFEEGVPGVHVDDTHIYIPIDKAMVSLSGEMQFSPSPHFGITVSVVTAKYDEQNNALEFHKQAFQLFRDYHPEIEGTEVGNNVVGLWVSQVPDPNMPLSLDDGRSDTFYNEKKSETHLEKMFHALKKNIPPDFFILDREETCTKELYEQLQKYFHEIDWDMDAYDTLIGMTTNGATDLVLAALLGMPCATFLTADNYPGTVMQGGSTFGVWVHMIMETEQFHAENPIGFNKFWNNWGTHFKD